MHIWAARPTYLFFHAKLHGRDDALHLCLQLAHIVRQTCGGEEK